jgi:hypothetical protein
MVSLPDDNYVLVRDVVFNEKGNPIKNTKQIIVSKKKDYINTLLRKDCRYATADDIALMHKLFYEVLTHYPLVREGTEPPYGSDTSDIYDELRYLKTSIRMYMSNILIMTYYYRYK